MLLAYQLKAEILGNQKIKANYFRCALQAGKIGKIAQPGQFLNIKVSDNQQPLLRRPFSIHKVKGQIEILYAVVGEGSRLLSFKKTGEYLDVIGPLGNGFNYRTLYPEPRTPILVAGGMGTAPLVFLAEKLKKCKTLVLIGAKTKEDILCEKEFKALGCAVKIATDDGSRGFKGKVTDLLKEVLGQRSKAKGQSALSPFTFDLSPSLYACGPRPMLEAISKISQEYNIPAQISLEEHMACGIGACLGCAINTIDGYQRVCKEGPVFAAEKIIWSNTRPYRIGRCSPLRRE